MRVAHARQNFDTISSVFSRESTNNRRVFSVRAYKREILYHVLSHVTTQSLPRVPVFKSYSPIVFQAHRNRQSSKRSVVRNRQCRVSKICCQLTRDAPDDSVTGKARFYEGLHCTLPENSPSSSSSSSSLTSSLSLSASVDRVCNTWPIKRLH